jgi:hypothetical protein
MVTNVLKILFKKLKEIIFAKKYWVLKNRGPNWITFVIPYLFFRFIECLMYLIYLLN